MEYTSWMNTNANDCLAAVHATIQDLIRHESEEMFETFFELAKIKLKTNVINHIA